jgi:hypothetical protein
VWHSYHSSSRLASSRRARASTPSSGSFGPLGSLFTFLQSAVHFMHLGPLEFRGWLACSSSAVCASSVPGSLIAVSIQLEFIFNAVDFIHLGSLDFRDCLVTSPLPLQSLYPYLWAPWAPGWPPDLLLHAAPVVHLDFRGFWGCYFNCRSGRWDLDRALAVPKDDFRVRNSESQAKIR